LLAVSTEAYGGHPSVVFLWDLATHHLIGNPIPGANFVFSADDSLLAVARYGDLVLYDLRTHRAITKPLPGHGKNISSIAFSPDGTIVATGAEDIAIIIWDVATRKSVGTLAGHSQTVSNLLFARDGESPLSGSLDGTILRWDLQDLKPSATVIKNLGASISSIFLNPDGGLRALALDKDRVILLNLNGDPQYRPILGFLKALRRCNASAAAIESGSKVVRLYRWSAHNCHPTLAVSLAES
jgi:WD40 repeat protein